MLAVEAVWTAVGDRRTAEQRVADLELEQEGCDEPDQVERLRQEAVALCSEFFAVLKQRNNAPAPECPGCAAYGLERRDLVAEQTMRVILGGLRRKRRRVSAQQTAFAL